MDLTTRYFDLRVTALQPIIHSEGTFGNIATFRRQKYVLASGEVVQLPIVSGNSIRNRLRNAIMWHMLHQCGLADGGQLDKRAVNLLFSGGVLDSSSQTMDIQGYWEMTRLIPALGLFGGGVGNALVPGCLRVGPLLPICAETTTLSNAPIPESAIPEVFHAPAVAAYMDTFQGTRKEIFKDKKYQKLLPSAEADATNKAISDGKKRGKKAPKDKGDSQQMIYHVECMAAGTLLYWRVGVEAATPLEYEALLTGLALMAQAPTVGGKAAVGFGLIKIEAVSMQTPLTLASAPSTSDVPALRVGEAYQRHLAENKEEIIAWLKKMK